MCYCTETTEKPPGCSTALCAALRATLTATLNTTQYQLLRLGTVRHRQSKLVLPDYGAREHFSHQTNTVLHNHQNKQYSLLSTAIKS